MEICQLTELFFENLMFLTTTHEVRRLYKETSNIEFN